MLGVPPSDVRQVAGDSKTGFYRAADGTLPYRELDKAGVAVEVYSWGSLTSGLAGILGWLRRALWLLLLPFALANLAYWARLNIDGSLRSRIGAKLTRLGALLLTVFMVLIPTIVGDDLIAWQCYRGGSPGCTRLPGVLDFLANPDAGQRLVVASALPLLFVGVLWMLSGQSLARYEALRPADTDRPGGEHDRLLQHPKLWDGAQRTGRLQRFHVAAAMAVVALVPACNLVGEPGEDAVLSVLLAVLVGLTGLAVFGVTLGHPDDIEMRGLTTKPWADSFAQRLLGLTAIAAAATLLWMWVSPANVNDTVDFDGHNLWFIGVFVLLTVVHLAIYTHERVPALWSFLISGVVVALAGWALVAHARPKPEDHQLFTVVLIGCGTLLLVGLSVLQFFAMRTYTAQAWGGAGASVMLAGAAWVALVFTTAAVTWTANYLNGADHGVADLVSVLGDNDKSEVTDVVDLDGRTLAVTGDVVIEGAIVTFRPDGQPMIHSGTVRSERLFNRDGPSGKAAPQKGRVEVESGTIVLDHDRVRFRDSCVMPAGYPVPTDDSIETLCTAESDQFTAGGTYLVPQASSEGEFRTTVPNRPPALHLCGPKGHPVVVAPTFPPEVPIVVPQVLIWAPLAQSLWVVGIVAILIGALWRFRPALPAIDALAALEIHGPRLAAARSARRSAAFAHKAERLVDAVGGLTAVLAIALIGFSALGEAPWVRYEELRPFATLGMTVALALGIGIVGLAARIRNSEGVRKGVGILWDLSTFWPRSAHPLAPPCYAERIVPELVTRVDWALDTTGGRAEQVILSGHSQGSVIVCAVLSRYSERDLARLRVITYGSQIRQLYGRVFPAVFGPDQIGYVPTPGEPVISSAFPDAPPVDSTNERGTKLPLPWSAHPHSLAHRLVQAGGRWVNLFRRTDPIGFRVFSDMDVEPDRYTSELAGRPGDLSAPIQGHGGMWHSPEYRAAVAEWTGEPVVTLETDTLGVPTLPS